VIRVAPEAVWIEHRERDTAIAHTVRARFAGPIEYFDERAAPAPRSVADGKRVMVLRRHRGAFLRHCPAGNAGLVCCNYLVVNLASNCPMDCSYCFLQEYLADAPALTAYTNVDAALAEIDAVLRAHPERQFRIGTGELSDSLALDSLTDLSPQLVRFFAARANATLELKTKTDCIDALLGCDPNGRVVVSWSVNAPTVIARDEPGTASLDERLVAARRVQAAGYRVGIHLDPLVEFPGWEEEYPAVVDAVAAAVDRDRLAWVSLGSLRVSGGLAQAIGRRRGHGGTVAAAELVPCGDGKARVWRGLRLRMYRTILAAIARAWGAVPVYLCMETADVWAQVMGQVPRDRDLGMRLAGGAPW
jgi:spore photoproduct lyase